ncbi:PKD domain-containing protein [Mucilaginibacter glaciei]|uniref:Gliding motility-associated C-terminal domain-containing protein n=1 Tax=Mucilaginibacter glaciei TaxID=2772109 RepID=A0A926NVP1_9SPHI|nr:PKD domain-containing protein [Mucilaginibacter glaciei]MBD1395422.1 gliding motility-associated C-terminal domain-containing protein [Mucilaginibacter glaciei]
MYFVLLRYYFVLTVLLVVFWVSANGQSTSNEGTEFWVTFPTHEADFDKAFLPLNANLSLFLTGKTASSGVVTVGNFKQRFTVSEGQVTEIRIPRSEAYVQEAEAGRVLTNRAVHILTDPGQAKIICYAHLFAGQRSAASLVLPKEALGGQYFSMNFQQHNGEGKNFITLVATEPNTRIFIRKNKVDLVPGGVLLDAVNDVYEFLSDEDLTGTQVTTDTATSACKSFAMFSGSSGVSITTAGCEPKSLDPLYQQCYPVQSWGRNYGFIPFAMTRPSATLLSRTAGQYLRVLAVEDMTLLRIDGRVVKTLNAGEYYTTESPLNMPALITGSKAISVAQFALSQSCSNMTNVADTTLQGYSDPDMVLLNPIEFNIADITVYSSTRENIKEQYVNILIKTVSAASFSINGAKPKATFKDYAPLAGYSYLQLNLNDYPVGTFKLSADEGFNAIAYGFGNVESYAYSAGTNLSANQAIVAVSKTSGMIIDSACTDEDYTFKLTLPYIAPRLSWQMSASAPPIMQEKPVFTATEVDGKPTYNYQLAKPAYFNVSGNYAINIVADYPSGQNKCGTLTQQILGAFKVLPLPLGMITSVKEDCNNFYSFNASGDTTGVAQWYWDFGDEKSNSSNRAEGRIARHVFTQQGTYIVKLYLLARTGCQRVVYDTIQVRSKPALSFSAPLKACRNKTVYFRAPKSSSPSAIRWIWRFGDGESIVDLKGDPVGHQFRWTGQFKISLSLQNAAGCQIDSGESLLTIDSANAPSFSFPATICLSDGKVNFTNTTLEIDAGNTANRYRWQFGDRYASATEPDTSVLKSPSHRYSLPGIYNVTLLLRNPNGCDSALTRQITVNGVLPKADFELKDDRGICGNSELVIQNKSSVVDGGTVSRLEWTFDSENQPGDRDTITVLRADNTYRHVYTPFYGPPFSRSLKVKLKAYSGQSCADSVSKTIIVYAIPKLRFDSIPPICMNTAPFALEATETTGIPAFAAKLTGRGLGADGLFNPRTAGVGIHTITYTFTTANLCTYTLTRAITVLAEPQIKLPENLNVRLGESILIKPVYSDKNLTYKWSPSTGLDNPSSPFPTANPIDDIKYTLIASNGICEVEQSFVLKVLKPLIINNTFTPNGDGFNDFLTIENLQNYPKANVNIFNRYGTKVYGTVGQWKPWDGNYNGKTAPVGVYYYAIDLKDGKTVYSGYIFLVR